MEILDSVYKTFCNLERDFKRSKKSRSEFIRDKFGGDIDIGSMIILDSISSNADAASAEDIEKMSFIKDIFSSIKANVNRLGQLSSFSVFSGGDPMEELMHLLNAADAGGMLQSEVSQAELYRQSRGTVHFICTANLTKYADLNKCKVLHAYNQHMCEMLNHSVELSEVPEIGSYYQMRSRGKATPIKVSEIVSRLR